MTAIHPPGHLVRQFFRLRKRFRALGARNIVATMAQAVVVDTSRWDREYLTKWYEQHDRRGVETGD